MSVKCPKCKLVDHSTRTECGRCGARLEQYVFKQAGRQGTLVKILIRAVVCLAVCVSVLGGFYLSLIVSAAKPDIEQKAAIRRATAVLAGKGFEREAFLLNYATTFRSNDNWLNASVAKENAYAATNFPFEIMTVYPDFFTYPADDTERAAILLHESKHLQGNNEHDAYEFVWKNRTRLGWTADKYLNSPVWRNVRTQTRDNVPELFNCPAKDYNDCTE